MLPVFVRNLAFDVSEQDLEDLFADVGPVKRCSIVKTPDGSSRGFGFVKFALEEDAQRAVERLNGHTLKGRKIQLDIAVRKGLNPVKDEHQEQEAEAQPKREGKAAKRKASDDAQSEAEAQDEVARQPSGKAKKAKTQPKPATEDREAKEAEAEDPALVAKREARKQANKAAKRAKRTVLLYNVDTCLSPAELKLRIEEVAPGCEVTIEPASEPIVFPLTDVITCVCASAPSAQALQAHFDGKTLKQLQLPVEKGKSQKLHVNARFLTALPDVKDPHRNKKGRVIVRNLSFQATEDDVGGVMSMFGPLTECRIPYVMVSGKKRSRGFAFVTYLFPADAKRVLARYSDEDPKPLHICGREVAVDLALSKEAYEATVQQQQDEDEEGEEEKGEEKEEEEESEDGEEGEEDEGGSEEDEDDDEEEDEEGDDEGDDEEAEEEAEEEADDEEGENEDDADEEKTDSEASEKEHKIHDVEEGRSIFIRDLPFTVTVDQLKETFRPFGRVLSAHIVMDPQTGRPRGSAFVQFGDAASAQTAVDAANSPRGIEVMGRQVVVNLAVDRNRAKTLTSSNTRKVKKDKRNLYLANEGMVAAGSEAAEGVPPIELEKRAAGQAEKKKKLANPLIFVSPVRLSVKNLNGSIDDKGLKKIALEGARAGIRNKLVGPQEMNRYYEAQGMTPAQITPDMVEIPPVKYASVKSAKVMLDLDKKPVNGVYKSKGYGFVEFTHHAHALAFLREVNNNPRYNHLTPRPPQKGSGVISRPMIEFCLEDANKVRILKARAEQSKKRVEAMRRAQQQGGEGRAEKQQDDDGSAKKATKGTKGAKGTKGKKGKRNQQGGKSVAKQGQQRAAAAAQQNERKQGKKRGRGADDAPAQQPRGEQGGARNKPKRARK